MKKLVWFLFCCAVTAGTCACNGKADQQAQIGRVGSKVAGAAVGNNQALARQFLSGVQEGDKQKMYAASNITTAMVDTSRDKLVHMKQNKLSDKERLEYEHLLRTSGDIDFFAGKLRKLFPKSCRFDISETAAKSAAPGTEVIAHTVTITYGDNTEAIHDKTGRAVKVMRLRLQQTSRMIDARLTHEFSFDSKDFDKMADRDFDVVSYF